MPAAILIIDDDSVLCEELAESLSYEGYQADYIVDPSNGADLIREGNYDVILLDYKMPGITGVDILESLAGEKLESRIFILTGRPFVKKLLESEGLAGMISGIIDKPVDFGQLLESIK